jgi:hypothetical protein
MKRRVRIAIYSAIYLLVIAAFFGISEKLGWGFEPEPRVMGYFVALYIGGLVPLWRAGGGNKNKEKPAGTARWKYPIQIRPCHPWYSTSARHRPPTKRARISNEKKGYIRYKIFMKGWLFYAFGKANYGLKPVFVAAIC